MNKHLNNVKTPFFPEAHEIANDKTNKNPNLKEIKQTAPGESINNPPSF